MLKTTLLVIIAVIAAPVPAAARIADPATICRHAAERAASESGIPREVMLALTLTETGRRAADGSRNPWAWALNRGGESLWFPSRQEALSYVERALSTGTTNIDLGCFQLNWHWHGAAFSSPETMIDPITNARYAARLIGDLYRRTGNWLDAAAAYHSATPEFATRYREKFGPIYAALRREGTRADPMPASPASPRAVNSFPLLQNGTSASAGSLVPAISRGIPLFKGL